jgi:hypothetical protein
MLSIEASAARKNEKEKVPPPKIYKEKVKAILDTMVFDQISGDVSPLSDQEQEDLKSVLRRNDKFLYNPQKTLNIKNETLHINMTTPGIPVIKLGHTFTTTLIFTDSAGNPWTADTLTDISDGEVVSVEKKAPHIITIRPKKMAGKTNLPIKLKGHQRPITFLFDITDNEVYFDVDVKIDGMGDHPRSQQSNALNQYMTGAHVAPKLNQNPAHELMLQSLTPEGFVERKLFNEYREKVDERDFMAWSSEGKLFLLTPHHSFSPEPTDISAASDGRNRLMVFDDIPVLAVRKNSKIFWLNIE